MGQLIDTEIEAIVLGSILVGGEPVFRGADLSEQDFTAETHRTVFRAMCEIVADVHPTIEAVAQELIARGDLEKVGGLAGIVGIHAKAIPGLRIAGLAGTLRELTRKRRACKVSDLIAEQVSLGLNADVEGIKRLAEELAELATKDSGSGPVQRVEDLPAVASAAELIRYLREPELPEGSVVALTGDSGSGKSSIATAFIRDAIAKGIPCLILDRETPRPVAADRMRRLGLADSEFLRWWGGWTGDAPTPNSPEVVRWVRSCEQRPIVVIDSLIAFLEGDENDATVMRAFMHGARRLADSGATIIVIHHDGKADSARDFRGSSDFKAAVDQAFHVTNISRDGKLDRLNLRCFKSRYGFCGSLVYQYSGGRFTRDEREDPPARTAADQLTEILRTNPGIGSREFDTLAAKRGLTRSQTREFINKGALTGVIRRETGAKNRIRHYLVETE